MNNDSTRKPLARTDITVQEMGNEVMLYDSSGEKIHVLNLSAFAIWKLCTGSHTVAEIIEQMAACYPDASVDLENDIEMILADFMKKGLLV